MIRRASARCRNQCSLRHSSLKRYARCYAAVEALDKGVLDWLARLDEVEPHAPAVGPLVQRLADHLRPVCPGQSRRAAHGFPPGDLGHGRPGCPARTRLPGKEVSTSIAGHSREKSSTMLSVRNLWPVASRSCWKSIDQRSFGAPGHQQGVSLGPADPLALVFSHLEALLDVDPMHGLVVHPPPLAAQQDMQTPIAEAPTLGRQIAQALAQAFALLLARLVLPGRKFEIGQPTSPALAEAMRRDQMRNHFPLAGRPHHFRLTALRAHRYAMPSRRHGPGELRPAASSAWHSPPRAPSGGARRKPPSHRTSTST